MERFRPADLEFLEEPMAPSGAFRAFWLSVSDIKLVVKSGSKFMKEIITYEEPSLSYNYFRPWHRVSSLDTHSVTFGPILAPNVVGQAYEALHQP